MRTTRKRKNPQENAYFRENTVRGFPARWRAVMDPVERQPAVPAFFCGSPRQAKNTCLKRPIFVQPRFLHVIILNCHWEIGALLSVVFGASAGLGGTKRIPAAFAATAGRRGFCFENARSRWLPRETASPHACERNYLRKYDVIKKVCNIIWSNFFPFLTRTWREHDGLQMKQGNWKP